MGRMKKNARRPHGSGSLVKDPRTQIWIGRIRINGKVYTKSTGSRDRGEAERIFSTFTSNFILGSEKSTLEHIQAKMMGVDLKMERKRLDEEERKRKHH